LSGIFKTLDVQRGTTTFKLLVYLARGKNILVNICGHVLDNMEQNYIYLSSNTNKLIISGELKFIFPILIKPTIKMQLSSIIYYSIVLWLLSWLSHDSNACEWNQKL